MDPHSIIENGGGQDTPRADAPRSDCPGIAPAEARAPQPEFRGPSEDGGQSLAELARENLDATLQLLAERSQYITAATGAAIALRSGEEFVCRASAGGSAPDVGSLLQVDSGLSGESVRTKQTLRCDDASTDPRVNRESCEALGIASVVVMPLLHEDVVIGVFELFSDKPNAFEPRDLSAMERMAALVSAALEHAQGTPRAQSEAEVPAATQDERTAEPSVVAAAQGPGGAPVAEQERRPAPVAGGSVVPQISEMVEGATTEAGPAGETAAKLPTEPVPDVANSQSATGMVSHARIPARGVAGAPTSTGVPVANAEAAEIEPGERVGLVEAEDRPTEVSPDTEPRESVPGKRQAKRERPSIAAATLEATKGADVGSEAPMVVQAPSAEAAQKQPRREVAKLGRCQACGFPVSEGRQLCLDCERKTERKDAAGTESDAGAGPTPAVSALETVTPATSIPRYKPGLLGHGQFRASWLASHKYMVGAIVIAVLAIAVLLLTR
jgi:putative methionine-R-sulfoxide reductase with GAF domain